MTCFDTNPQVKSIIPLKIFEKDFSIRNGKYNFSLKFLRRLGVSDNGLPWATASFFSINYQYIDQYYVDRIYMLI